MIKSEWQKKFSGERVYSSSQYKDKVHCGSERRQPEPEDSCITISIQEVNTHWCCFFSWIPRSQLRTGDIDNTGVFPYQGAVYNILESHVKNPVFQGHFSSRWLSSWPLTLSQCSPLKLALCFPDPNFSIQFCHRYMWVLSNRVCNFLLFHVLKYFL